jgi:hypothetical protein
MQHYSGNFIRSKEIWPILAAFSGPKPGERSFGRAVRATSVSRGVLPILIGECFRALYRLRTDRNRQDQRHDRSFTKRANSVWLQDRSHGCHNLPLTKSVAWTSRNLLFERMR